VDTLGSYPARLFDVAVVHENDIWAVGEIPGYPGGRHNAAHWNGSEWEFLRLEGKTYAGTWGYAPLKAVCAFSANDVWVMFNFGSYAHWDGEKWKSEFIWERYGSILRIWGTSSHDLYFIGTDGNITHYNGQSFTKMESSTTLVLRSISGSKDWVFASGHDMFDESIVLEYNGSVWSTKYHSQTSSTSEGKNILGWVQQVYFTDNKLFIFSEAGLWSSPISTNEGELLSYAEVKMPTTAYVQGFDGNHCNDLMLAGSPGYISHYNGISWVKINDEVLTQFRSTDINLFQMRYKDNMVVAVGNWKSGRRAFIMRGYRVFE